ncbi:hypothetical protein C6497_08325 [Candidatus Poribacteria bacterium]|nr:MAG: hypothetical protein C6497_08325 [Candidatus Poribacteria bacterium]
MYHQGSRLILLFVMIISVLMVVELSYSGQAITDGLVSYWSFNENTVPDKTVKDIVAGNDGTINGSVEVVDGKIKEALKFSGGHVDCGTDKSLIAIGNELTLEMWIKPERPGWAIIAGVSRSGNNSYVVAWSDTSRLDFNIWNGALETWPFHSASQLTLNEWHHVAGVYDSTEALIYINGELDNQKKFEGEIKHNGENFWMGARKVGGLPYHGLLDELRLYNRGLSQAEIEKNMKAEGLAVDPNQKLSLRWGTIKVSR